ncbi:MAG: ABC transporter substrate-binding protein [Clostridiales bacterium]
MKKRNLALLLTVLFVLAAFAGCGSPAASTPPATTATTPEATEPAASGIPAKVAPGYENIMRMVTNPQPDTCDPQKTTEFFCVNFMIFNRLAEAVTTGPGKTELIPSLAEKWEISEDALEYTFYLRKDVKFHNGNDFTAEDVKYTFERMLWPETGAKNQDFVDPIVGSDEVMAGATKELSGVTILDDYTIKVKLKMPFGPFIASMAAPAMGILDKEATEAAGADFGLAADKTIGTGPYYFDKWVLNDELLVKRFDGYWDKQPELEGISWKIISDAETMRMMFEAGELDVFDTEFALSQLEYFTNSPKYANNIVAGDRVGIYYLTFNQQIKPFDDVRVRKALQMAMDRQGLVDALNGGRGTPRYGIFPPGVMGYNPNLPEIPYDVEKAKALLAEAGYPDGFEMTIAHDSSSTSALPRVELLASLLEDIGLKVTIDSMDSATWFATRAEGKLPAYTSSWSADYNDPDNFIYTFFAPGNTVKRSFNFNNPALSKRIVDARAIVDPAAREKEYQALEIAVIQEEAAWIPLYSVQHVFLVNDRLQGFKPAWNGWSDGWYYYDGLRIVN